MSILKSVLIKINGDTILLTRDRYLSQEWFSGVSVCVQLDYGRVLMLSLDQTVSSYLFTKVKDVLTK